MSFTHLRLSGNSCPKDMIRLISQATSAYHRLILVVGQESLAVTGVLREASMAPGSSIVNLSLELSRRLLEMTKRDRALRSPQIINDIIRGEDSESLCLDHTDVLFEPSLALDPLRCLQDASRNRLLIVAWNGRTEDGHLVHAEMGHPEYKRPSTEGLLVINAKRPR